MTAEGIAGHFALWGGVIKMLLVINSINKKRKLFHYNDINLNFSSKFASKIQLTKEFSINLLNSQIWAFLFLVALIVVLTTF